MPESYPHLQITREEPVNEKRPAGNPRPATPNDIPAHGRRIQQTLEAAKTEAQEALGGFDERRLFRFKVEKGFDPDDLRKISTEIEFVSQEDETIAVGFATDAALAEFESRLVSLIQGEHVVNKQVLFALTEVGSWTPENRTGWALKKHGIPTDDNFFLDVELWPLEDKPEGQDRIREAFEAWLQQNQLSYVDRVRQHGLSLYRVRCEAAQVDLLLSHRDVRTVDLPPQYGLERALVFQDVQNFTPTPSPPDDAPGVTVLDSGILTGHPLLSSAVGDAQSFLPGEDAVDENGHGTHVAGLALYGDFEESLRSGQFVPQFRLFSGRILDRNNENATGFVENQIEEAVRYFHEHYGCKVFNLSFGDWNKPYLGGHLKGLSVTLDTLSRELDVLFVVSTGNHQICEESPEGLGWRERYPDYLLEERWSVIEPAPALNVLTVGSVARHDRTFNSQKYPTDAHEVPIANPNQPSPFSLRGPSVDGAMKPELVAHGGNWAVDTGVNRLIDRVAGLGVISTGIGLAPDQARPFSVDSGTSMAAPQITHLAAMVLKEMPDADANLLRALLCANACIPQACKELLPHPKDEKKISKELRQVCGYGEVNVDSLSRSLENTVTLWSGSQIANKRYHFYELPIPEDLLSAGKRVREISIGLAYMPKVRSTRIKYRATRIDFKLVAAPDLAHVTTMFNKATDKEDYDAIPELNGATVGATLRGKGTVQADTWRFSIINNRSKLVTNRLFLVVTRNDFPWGEALCDEEESYSLVACIRDRENEEARLYTQIRAQIQARLRARARA
jgi:hypothetical protein